MLKSMIGLIDHAMQHIRMPVKDPAPSIEFQQRAIEQAAAKRERKCLKRMANNLTKE